jgi:hypothetical protein
MQMTTALNLAVSAWMLSGVLLIAALDFRKRLSKLN